MYGTDDLNDISERIIMACICSISLPSYIFIFFNSLTDLRLQCYFCVRLSIHGDTSHYACPLDICTEILGDLNIKPVLSAPLGENNRVGLVSEAGVKSFDWRKIHTSSEYHPDHTPEGRTTNKPTRRLTLAEIFIPYGDSCAPYSWKGAFDWGAKVLV
ncbi:uncharacterized protein N7446_012810 [Penicillium canescens]|uniref:Uncharacterized protein n=1 Tax=Penicillium canescens TaxID=5083 RepID=A0AAD6HXT9_PENCN|nr:uncharacterized protein N7446_012810 [Penicillium canescens]KAJ6022458.1 hypothetical protein N7460_012853 [Penicillium canescens]KAJ6041744.1 hypothetical protein N7446_012810 [Penicillium canescens]